MRTADTPDAENTSELIEVLVTVLQRHAPPSGCALHVHGGTGALVRALSERLAGWRWHSVPATGFDDALDRVGSPVAGAGSMAEPGSQDGVDTTPKLPEQVDLIVVGPGSPPDPMRAGAWWGLVDVRLARRGLWVVVRTAGRSDGDVPAGVRRVGESARRGTVAVDVYERMADQGGPGAHPAR